MLFQLRLGQETTISYSPMRPRSCWSLACSTRDLGSTVTEITGSGNLIDSRTIGRFLAQSVSPVDRFFIVPMAMMSPAKISLISFRLLACISRKRDTRSSSSLPGL